MNMIYYQNYIYFFKNSQKSTKCELKLIKFKRKILF